MDFLNFVAQSTVAIAVLIIAVAVTSNELESFINGISIDSSQTAKFAVNAIIVIFMLGIFLIPSVKGNVVKIINKPLEYTLKIMDKVLK